MKKENGASCAIQIDAKSREHKLINVRKYLNMFNTYDSFSEL